MIDIVTVSDTDSWIISVGMSQDDSDYQHMSELIDQCDAINAGWA